MYDYEKLGRSFRQLRKNRQISLKQVAGEAVSLSQLSRFERGETDLMTPNMKKREGELSRFWFHFS